MNSPDIKATIIADSISHYGQRMTTFEIEYPRFILAELNTHRMLSKNSASSRAIPVKAMHEHIIAHPATPVFWGKNQPGMQAKEELSSTDLVVVQDLWCKAMYSAIDFAAEMSERGLHKQIANRPTETWMTMKTVISGTEWANLYHLRYHGDAQPEFHVLAAKMYQAHKESTPTYLSPGEWHLPYVETIRDENGFIRYVNPEGGFYSLEDARIVSASCCAQVSYRKNDDSLEKARKIYKQLIESTPAHASPVEHQATPMPDRYGRGESTRAEYWPEGVTHIDRESNYWSGNLKGWIQFRKLIPNEAVWGRV